MTAIKAMQMRINAMESTRKVTLATKMMAASKFRKLHTNFSGDSYVKAAKYAYSAALQEVEDIMELNTLSRWLIKGNTESDKHVLIAMGSERGFCGAFNVQLISQLHTMTYDTLIPVGKRFNSMIKANARIAQSFEKFDSSLKDYLLLLRPRTVSVVSQRFISLMNQRPTVLQLIPLQVEKTNIVTCEPNIVKIIDTISSMYFDRLMHNIVTSHALAESASRMIAMENASRNADNKIKELKIERNKMRQAIITKELSEIVSGANF